jgi:ABC-type transport system involved in cytochrome bd biosynthesis fused ATPase/permease subunit
MFSIIITVLTAIVQIISNVFNKEITMSDIIFGIYIIVAIFAVIAIKKVIGNKVRKIQLTKVREFVRQELMAEKEVLANAKSYNERTHHLVSNGRMEISNLWESDKAVKNAADRVNTLRRKLEIIDNSL